MTFDDIDKQNLLTEIDDEISAVKAKLNGQIGGKPTDHERLALIGVVEGLEIAKSHIDLELS